MESIALNEWYLSRGMTEKIVAFRAPEFEILAEAGADVRDAAEQAALRECPSIRDVDEMFEGCVVLCTAFPGGEKPGECGLYQLDHIVRHADGAVGIIRNDETVVDVPLLILSNEQLNAEQEENLRERVRDSFEEEEEARQATAHIARMREVVCCVYEIHQDLDNMKNTKGMGKGVKKTKARRALVTALKRLGQLLAATDTGKAVAGGAALAAEGIEQPMADAMKNTTNGGHASMPKGVTNRRDREATSATQSFPIEEEVTRSTDLTSNSQKVDAPSARVPQQANAPLPPHVESNVPEWVVSSAPPMAPVGFTVDAQTPKWAYLYAADARSPPAGLEGAGAAASRAAGPPMGPMAAPTLLAGPPQQPHPMQVSLPQMPLPVGHATPGAGGQAQAMMPMGQMPPVMEAQPLAALPQPVPLPVPPPGGASTAPYAGLETPAGLYPEPVSMPQAGCMLSQQQQQQTAAAPPLLVQHAAPPPPQQLAPPRTSTSLQPQPAAANDPSAGVWHSAASPPQDAADARLLAQLIDTICAERGGEREPVAADASGAGAAPPRQRQSSLTKRASERFGARPGATGAGGGAQPGAQRSKPVQEKATAAAARPRTEPSTATAAKKAVRRARPLTNGRRQGAPREGGGEAPVAGVKRERSPERAAPEPAGATESAAAWLGGGGWSRSAAPTEPGRPLAEEMEEDVPALRQSLDSIISSHQKEAGVHKSEARAGPNGMEEGFGMPLWTGSVEAPPGLEMAWMDGAPRLPPAPMPRMSTAQDANEGWVHCNNRNGVALLGLELGDFKELLCKYYANGNCMYGKACHNRHLKPAKHSMHELIRYKTKLCPSFAKAGSCQFGSTCRFAHGEDDLLPMMALFRYPEQLEFKDETRQLVRRVPFRFV